MNQPAFRLAPIFRSAQAVIEKKRLELNQADPINGNHGDHMVEILTFAVQAIEEKQDEGMAEAMQYAAERLVVLQENGSAQVYGRGLAQFGAQFAHYEISLDNLERYVRDLIRERNTEENRETSPQAGDILKALLAGLAGWQQAESGAEKATSVLDLGYMFDLGIAYMQAKQRGGSRFEIIAETAATVSPLNAVPHRRRSGVLTIRALLEALAIG